MKTLLTAKTPSAQNVPVALGYASNSSEVVQIVTHNSGFDHYAQLSPDQGPSQQSDR